MSSTIAIDGLRPDRREHSQSSHADRDQLAPVGSPFARKLNDALAELGPARPGREPWSRARSPRDRGQVAAVRPAAPQTVALAASDDKAATIDLPPPAAPFAGSKTENTLGDVTLSRADLGLGDVELAEGDVAGADIVRALAEIGREQPRADAPMPREFFAFGSEEEALERPPMIIERAIAEQSGALKSVTREVSRANPMPGLAIGFSLSLVAGAALYLALAGG